MDPGSGDPGEIVYSGLPGNTVGMATMVDMSEASKQKSASTPTVDAHELHRVALTRHLNEILRGVAF